MSLKKLASETAIYGVSSILGRILGFVLVPYYTRIFSTAEYGIVSLISASIAFVMVLYTYRMELAYFRYGTDKNLDRTQIFNVCLSSIVLTTLFFTIIFFFLAPTYAEYQHIPDRVNLIYLALGIIFFDVLNEIPKAKLRLDSRPIRFAFIQMTNIGVNLGLVFFFLLFCPIILENESLSFIHGFINKVYHPNFGIGYIFLANIIASFIVFLLLLPEWKNFKLLIDKLLWKKMMKYSLPMAVVGFSFIINEMLDRTIMINYLPGSIEENKSQLGIYSANYKIAMILALFFQAFRYGAEPFFFKQKDKKEAYQSYADVAKYFFIISILGFLFITLYLDFFKQIIDEPYWEGISVVPILLMANLFLGMYYNFSVWYKISDRTMFGAYISMTGAIVTILLNMWWLPIFGYHGSAWATVICYGLMMSLSYILGRKYLPMPYQIGKMFSFLILGIGTYLLSVWLNDLLKTTPISYFGLNTLLLLIYCSILWIIERKELKKALQQ